MKRFMGFSAAAVAVVVCLVGAFSVFGPGKPVNVAVAERGEIHTYIEERGKTRLPQTYIITMPLDGRVLPITKSEGDVVAAGDKVAELETADFDTAVAEAEARIEQLKRRIVENDDSRLEDSAVAQFDEYLRSMDLTILAAEEQTKASQAKSNFAKSEYDRLFGLFQKPTKTVTESQLSEADLLRKESQVDQAKDVLTLRSMESIRSAMVIAQEMISKYIDKKGLKRDILEAELAEAEHALTRLKRDRGRTAVTSPVTGTVLERFSSNERVLPAGQELLEIGRLEELEAEVEVLSQEVVDVRPGQRVEIGGPAIGREPISGTVTRVYPRGFTKVSSLGVEQQRVLVVIGFDEGELNRLAESSRHLGADYRIRVRIFTEHRSNALTIPRSALFRGPTGQWQVYVVRDGKATLVNVSVGLMNDSEVEVTSGIDDGEPVILAPDFSVEDGSRVAPREVPQTADLNG